ncbi:diphthamide biosynthesis protein-like protein 4 [Xylogone sp. PMI_703]|nr:diphthamide biosynthesis protein-like protein 4 [Xylogone sp. PMI_703]
MTPTISYYEILGIPQALYGDSNVSVKTIRSAYRRALLHNHPDKAQVSQRPTATSRNVARYSIDQISQAYTTLSNPKLRAEYDTQLKLQTATSHIGEKYHTGVEVADLDDLEVDEANGTWYRSCRCGDDRGYLITEQDLEEAAADGELDVGCNRCSLWLKVLFGVIEEDGEEEESKKE